jgi:hypothetical protein
VFGIAEIVPLDTTNTYEIRRFDKFEKPINAKIADVFKETIPRSALEILRTTEARQEAAQSARSDTVACMRFFYPAKGVRGYRIGEVFEIEEIQAAVEKNFPVAVEKKYDGNRIQIHFCDNRFEYWSDNGFKYDEKKLPHTSEYIRKHYKGVNFVIDSEVEKWVEGKHSGRQVVAGELQRDQPADDQYFITNIFDIVFLDGKDLHKLTFAERRKILEGTFKNEQSTIEKPDEKRRLNLAPSFTANNKNELKTHIRTVSAPQESEGAMIKTLNVPLPLTGVTQHWIKFKKIPDVDVEVVKKEETKTPNVFKYHIAVRMDIRKPYTNPFEIRKGLIYVGKTLNSKENVSIGQILRVAPENVYVEDKPESFRVRLYVTKVIEIREDKTVPDTVTTVLNTFRAVKKPILKPKEALHDIYDDSHLTADEKYDYFREYFKEETSDLIGKLQVLNPASVVLYCSSLSSLTLASEIKRQLDANIYVYPSSPMFRKMTDVVLGEKKMIDEQMHALLSFKPIFGRLSNKHPSFNSQIIDGLIKRSIELKDDISKTILGFLMLQSNVESEFFSYRESLQLAQQWLNSLIEKNVDKRIRIREFNPRKTCDVFIYDITKNNIVDEMFATEQFAEPVVSTRKTIKIQQNDQHSA